MSIIETSETMWSDPIADLLTRIRNAVSNGSPQVEMPYSKVKSNICEVLKQEGYINGFDRIENQHQGILRIDLKYGPHGEKVILEIKRASRVGRRLFCGWKEIPRVLNGMGIMVVSTSRGVMSDRRCRDEKVGGELICSVY